MNGCPPATRPVLPRTWRRPKEIRRLQPAAIVVDSPEVPEDYLATMRRLGLLVVSVDSQSQLRFPSRLIVNPLLGPTREAYEFNKGTQVLLALAMPWCVLRSAGFDRSGPKSRRNPSASSFLSATMTQTTSPENWPRHY